MQYPYSNLSTGDLAWFLRLSGKSPPPPHPDSKGKLTVVASDRRALALAEPFLKQMCSFPWGATAFFFSPPPKFNIRKGGQGAARWLRKGRGNGDFLAEGESFWVLFASFQFGRISKPLVCALVNSCAGFVLTQLFVWTASSLK